MTRACVALLAVMCSAGCARDQDADVERLQVELTLRADGSVEAIERWRVRVQSDRFRLQRPLDRHDEVVDVTASVDGRPAAEGTAPGQTVTRRGDGLDVEWRLRGGGVYDLEVRYRAIGTVAVRGLHAALSWRITPENALHFGAASITLTLPAGTQTSADPYVEDHGGWTVERSGDVVRAQARDLPAGRAATLVVPFIVDARAIDEPSWQRDAARGRDLLPAFISGALFVLVVAAGAIVMIRAQYPRRGGAPADPARMAVARGLRIAGIATVIFGVAATPFTEWGLGRYGPWAYALPVSVIVSGVAFLLFGARKQI